MVDGSRDDQPNGHGIFTWPDGARYEGKVPNW